MAFLAGIGLVIIVARLVAVQVFTSSYYAAQMKTQSERRLLLPSVRGSILDRRGERLAYEVEKSIDIGSLKDAIDDIDNVTPLVSLTGKLRYTKLNRIYPHGALCGQVIGFIGRDGYGLAGIEYAFDDWLRGSSGWAVVGRDGKRRKYPIEGTPKVIPVQGCHVKLTIDAKLQAIVEIAMCFIRSVFGRQHGAYHFFSGCFSVGARNGNNFIARPPSLFARPALQRRQRIVNRYKRAVKIGV